MKLVTYEIGDCRSVGIHTGDTVVDVNRPGSAEQAIPSMLDLLAMGQSGLAAAQAALAAPDAGERTHAAAEVRLLAPIPRPGKVLCLGMNYRDHAIETGKDIPTEPVVFCKAPTSVIPAGAPIRIPLVTSEVDYEVELGVVIGRAGKNIPAGAAMGHVFGYTVVNDVSGREYQNRKPGGQWFLGKSFDTFCPMGPWIVTADEIGDPHALPIRCTLNGERVQESNTRHLIFTIPAIIEYVSKVMTLEPGDVIATGTPHGVGMARKPPLWLKAGDTVVCEVEGIGSLTNPVAAEQ